jgi:hypothetical protein
MLLMFFVLLLVVGCGGGGSNSVTGTITPAPTLRSDLLFGYYYSNSSTINETAPHANLHWASYEFGPAEQMAGLIQARANGQRVVLMFPGYDAPLEQRESETRFWLDRLRNAGLLWDGIVALYPSDEPDLAGKSDAEVTATNAAIRRAAADYPELGSGLRLAVIYACTSQKRPGLASYDWIGCDDYDRGCSVLNASAAIPDLLAALRPDQRLMVVAGGADPWKQDPACFASYAHREPRVAALIAFLWQPHSKPGIRDNGMRRLYCETGRVIAGNAALTC